MDFPMIVLSLVSLWCIFFAVILMVNFLTKRTFRFAKNTKIRERVALLPPVKLLKHDTNFILGKIIHEAKIFNRLCLVTQCIGRSPKEYMEYIGKIYINPKKRFSEIPVSDCITFGKEKCPYQRLMYLYACLTLYSKIKDKLTRKQLIKNMMYCFYADAIIKRRVKFTKLATCKYFALAPSCFKVLGDRKIISRHSQPKFDITIKGHPVQFDMHFSDSCVLYSGKDMLVRESCAKSEQVTCYSIKPRTNQSIKFSYKTEQEKMGFRLSQTANAFFCVCNLTKKTIAIYTESKERFGTNMTGRANDLKVNIELELQAGKPADIFIIEAGCKQEALKTIARLKDKGGRVNYLLTKTEIFNNAKVEGLLSEVYNSKYIQGTKLRLKQLQTQKIVPTLHLPTKVIIIENQQDFFDFVDNLDIYRRVISLGMSMNIICLYSSQNDVTEIMHSFMDTQIARHLIENNIFIFFVDKMTMPIETVNLFCKMHEASQSITTYLPVNVPVTTHSKVLVSTQIKEQVQSIIVASKLNKSVEVGISVPLSFTTSIISKTGARLNITSTRTGRSHTIKLPNGVTVYNAIGIPLSERMEYITDKIIIQIQTRMKPYEEKIFEVKKMPITSIENSSEQNLQACVSM